MIKISVLEDESKQTEKLKSFLERYAKENDFTYSLQCYDRAFTLIDSYKRDVDLLFMDIQVPDMLGIKAAHCIRDVDSEVMIIFLTNLTQYAIEGYNVNAFDYILKPVSYEVFSAKLSRAVRVLSHKNNDMTLDLRTKEGGRRVRVGDVSYIEVFNHDILIHIDDEQIRQWGTLSYYEELLREEHFVRCNTSHLVNLKYVHGVENNQVIVGEARLPISKPRRKEFLNALAHYKGGSK